MNYCVNIIYSEKLSRYYIGTTDNFEKRLNEHNDGFRKEAFTFDGIPWKKIIVIAGLSSAIAYRLEKHLKKMKSSKYIENLVQYPEIIEKLIKRFS